ncbi:unnamed protein product [Mesocestoides corti]|uniref:Tyrosine specific protein phosphatases domain-containing protein n=1 Tax=Mesocestoides corti TaxID=53468 RepID=A0A0R3UMY2_MESCO|nr:unnamed protein product [Mesocestoides corti]
MSLPPGGFSWREFMICLLLCSVSLFLYICVVFDRLALKHHFYPVDEFTIGDLEMVREIVNIIAAAETNGEKCGVHCQFGQMRTGTILAAYLAYHNKVNGKEAIKLLSKMRPKSLFSPESEKVICAFAASLNN